MLCYATAERSAKGTYYNADEMIAQLTQCIHIRGARKAVPAIASTHPRAREGGAKADLDVRIVFLV